MLNRASLLLCGMLLAMPASAASPLSDAGLDRSERRLADARAMLAADRGAEAWGALQALLRDEPEKAADATVAELMAWAALRIGRHQDAALLAASLPAGPTRCVVTLLAADHVGALVEPATVACALAGRPNRALLLAAGRAYLSGGNPGETLRLLARFRLTGGDAALLKGRALAAAGRHGAAIDALRVAGASSHPRIAAVAAVELIEAERRLGRVAPDAALRRLDALALRWRGGAVERRLHEVRLKIAEDARDAPAAMLSLGVLLRHFPDAAQGPGRLARMRALLGGLLRPGSGMALQAVADLYWANRDLLPPGPAGEAMARDLALRLAGAGLPGQAAAILEHQALERAEGAARVPLASLAAAFRLKAGDAVRAVALLERVASIPTPPDAEARRRRLHAVALVRSGRGREALAMLDGLPSAPAFAAELTWAAGDLPAFLRLSEGLAAGSTPEARQMAVMRAAARARLGLSAAPARDAAARLLALPAAGIDAQVIGQAMQAVPKASGDRLLALALDCAGELTATLACRVRPDS